MARNNVIEVLINGRNKAGNALKAASLQIKMFGAAVTAAFALATKRAMDFERGLAEISTLLDGDTSEAIQGISKDIQDMAITWGQSLDKLTKARYDIISSGFTDATESAEVLTAANRLAVAGVTDVAQTADILTTALNAYGLAAEDAGAVSDILFQTVRKGKTTLPELAASMGNIFATAKTAGVGLDEIGAAMATVTAKGINTNEATTALNGLLLALAAPTSEAAKELSKLGINLDNGLGPALEGLANVGEEGVDKLQALIPNIRALKAAAAAGSDIEGFNENLGSMRDALGVTDVAAKKMMASASFAMDQYKSSIDVLLVVLGESFLPGVNRTIRRLTVMADFVRNNKDAIFEFGSQVLMTVGHLAAVATAFIAVKRAVVLLKNASMLMNKQFWIAIGTWSAVLGALGGLDWVLRKMDIDAKLLEGAANLLDEGMAKLIEKVPMLGTLMEQLDGSFGDTKEETDALERSLEGLGVGLRNAIVPDLVDNLHEIDEEMKRLAEDARITTKDVLYLAESVAQDLGQSLVSLLDGASAVDALKSVLRNLVSSVISFAIRMGMAKIALKMYTQAAAEATAANAALAASMAAVNVAGGGIPAGAMAIPSAFKSIFATGGVVKRAATGILVGGQVGRDTIPVLAQSGEGILTRQTTAGILRDLRMGGEGDLATSGSGGQTINNRYNVNMYQPMTRREVTEFGRRNTEAQTRAGRNEV